MLGVGAASTDQRTLLLSGLSALVAGMVSSTSCSISLASSNAAATNISYCLAAEWGPCAGAMSMAAGEYISVASQKDTEEADVEKERQQQEKGPEAREHELEELAQIYVGRGCPYSLAREVTV